MSALRIICDTNVLVDLFEAREPYSAVARKLIIMREFGDAELWASAQSFADIFYIERKTFGSKRTQEAFEESFKWLEICSVDAQDIHSAAAAKWHDFEDCIINTSAEKIKADYLITRNKKDFAQSSCTVLTPQELFELLDRERGLTYDEVAF